LVSHFWGKIEEVLKELKQCQKIGEHVGKRGKSMLEIRENCTEKRS
jgi:hypothetical protein